MKSLKNFIILLVLVSLTVSSLSAQDAESFLTEREEGKKVQFGVKVGSAMYQGSWAFGAEAKYWFEEDIAIGVDIEYNFDSFEDDFSGEELYSYSNIPVSVNLFMKSPMGSSSESYIYYGAGITAAYRSAAERWVWIPQDEQEKSGFGIGGNVVTGFNFEMVFVESKFNYYFIDSTDALDLRDYDFTIFAGVRF